MKLRKVLSLFVALAMMLEVLPLSLFANDMESMAEYTVSESVTVDASSLADNDELFEGYLEQLFGTGSNSGIMLAATYTGEDALDDVNLEVYTALKSAVANIASGAESSTVVEMTLTYDYSDFGVSTLEDAVTAFSEALDITSVVSYLLNDCPYELYWFDKTASVEIASSSISGSGTTMTVPLTVTMPVASAYQASGSTTTVDSSKVTAAQTAASYAQSLVSTYSSYSDEAKLEAFKEAICSLVSYETDYASADFGDIWQRVYVFDQDTSTNVVCEGYSKAFQYLCDLAGLESIIVTGTMSGGTGAGEHMWNVVYLDGVNYLVDVTNSDTGSVGQDGGLFMVCADDADASDETGYTFTVNNQTVSYVYDSTTLGLYPEDYLTLGTVTADEYTITVYADGCTYDVVSSANEGDEVTVTITPMSTAQTVDLTYREIEYDETYGYEYIVQSEEVTYTGESSYTYTFTMPGNDVEFLIIAGEYEVTYSTEGYGFAYTNLELANEGDNVVINAWVYDGCSLLDISVVDAYNNVITLTYSGNSTIYFYNSDGEFDKTAINEVYEFTMPASDVTVTVTFSEAPYSITVDDNIENGTITTYSTSAIERDSIPFLVEPDEGYAISEVTVTKKSGETVEFAYANNEGNGLYIFYMPASDVTISAVFEKDHTHTLVKTGAVDATCTEDGNIEYWYCEDCNTYFSDEDGTTEITLENTIRPATGHTEGEAVTENEVAATGHTYGEPVFTWITDNTAIATVTCSVCGDEQELTCTVTSKTASSTCSADGEIVYTATVEFNGNTYTDTNTVVLNATGHNFGSETAEFSITVPAYALYGYVTAGDTFEITLPSSLCDEVTLPVTYLLTVNGVTVTLKGSDDTGSGTYTQTVEVGTFGRDYSEGTNAMVPQSTVVADVSELIITAIVDCSAYASDQTIAASAVDGVSVTYNGSATVTTSDMTVEKTYEGADITWTWAEDNSSATATFKCLNDSNHTEVVTATITSSTTDATCDKAGETVYTATATLDGITYTTTKTVTIDAAGHTYGNPEWTWTWSETEQTYTATAKFTCTVCGGTDTETALVTSDTTDATCTATGSTVYTAVVDMDGTSYSDTKTVELQIVAHTEGEAVTEDEVAATCTTDGSYESVVYCSVCGEELSRETIMVPATGHTTEIRNAVDATCTEDGYTGDEVCTVCGETITVGTVIPATGHSFNSEGVCEACGAKTGEDGTASTVTVESDDTIFANVLPSGLVTSTTISISNDNGGTLVVSTVVEVSAYPYLVEHIADTLSFTLYNEAQGDDLISDTNSFTITTTENSKKTLKKVTILFYGDVDYSGTSTSTVTMDFASASDLSSSDIYVLHYTGSYPTWEVVTSTVTFSDTTVTVEFEASDYSPFVVLSVASASSGGSSSALDILLRISANYSEVNEAITRANALNPADYVDFSAVTEAINAVNWNLKAINQLTVNAYADAINTAIDNLVKTTATITEETVNIDEPIEDTNTDTKNDIF